MEKSVLSILLERKSCIMGTSGSQETSPAIVATMLKNFEPLGYTLSPEAIEVLNTFGDQVAEMAYKQILPVLKEARGAHESYEPMYPNFPEQVMKASDAELYINAVLHYYGAVKGVRVMPGYEKDMRPELFENTKLTALGVCDIADYHQIFINMMLSKTSLSASDKEDLIWYLHSEKVHVPTDIPHKENLVCITQAILDGHGCLTDNLLSSYKTATDVLRLAVSMSAGDVSLAEHVKFRQFKRTERRILLTLLERTNEPYQDMSRFRSRWLRLGERLHPGDYFKKFPKAAAAFKELRNTKGQTYNSLVERALDTDLQDCVTLLSARPGDFARRLDVLLRRGKHDDHVRILSEFTKVTSKVSTPVLLQVSEHFNQRSSVPVVGKTRTFFPKGNASKVKVIDYNLSGIPEAVCTTVTAICDEALETRFGELAKLGKVYVDPKLKGYTVPLSQRSASKALKTIGRGSKLPFEDDKGTLRLFIWWKDTQQSTVDLDLSAVGYDAKWDQNLQISFTQLRNLEKKCAHSGDITSAPNGAAEFIDLDISALLACDCRYVVMSVLSYSGQPFVELPECFAGWMMREDVKSGEIFDARTVTQKFDVTADNKIAVPVVFDLLERKAIWCDLSFGKGIPSCASVESNQAALNKVTRGIVEMPKPDLHHLFCLHGASRGTLVDTKEEADIIFSETEGVKPTDFDEIVGKYL